MPPQQQPPQPTAEQQAEPTDAAQPSDVAETVEAAAEAMAAAAAEEEEAPVEISDAVDDAPAPSPGVATRRPSYVWAQNETHTFVTLSLSAHERKREPQVNYGKQNVAVLVPPGSSGDDGVTVSLELETYRQLVPTACEFMMTSRGLLLRLRKRTPTHWPRMLRSEMADGRQGVDWSRFSHPEAELAERRVNEREEFEQLNTARAVEMASLRPKFDDYLKRFREAKAAGLALEPLEQVEMLRLGEAILEHYKSEREERQRLLGDKPLPAAVEEDKLERALIHLRELERRGQLKYDRNTESWQEWRRRQAVRRKARGLDPETGKPL